jgi:ankyrin repeat protein
VQLLLRCGALVSVHDGVTQRTPVHAAVANGHKECLLLLLENTEESQVVDSVDYKKRSEPKHSSCLTTSSLTHALPVNYFRSYQACHDSWRVVFWLHLLCKEGNIICVLSSPSLTTSHSSSSYSSPCRYMIAQYLQPFVFTLLIYMVFPIPFVIISSAIL